MKDILIIRVVFTIVAVMYLILGFILPKVEQNSILGVRTKWAMKDKVIWGKTNKLAGRLMIISSLLTVLFIVFINYEFIKNLRFIFYICIYFILLLPAIIPTIYSYILYKNNKS